MEIKLDPNVEELCVKMMRPSPSVTWMAYRFQAVLSDKTRWKSGEPVLSPSRYFHSPNFLEMNRWRQSIAGTKSESLRE